MNCLDKEYWGNLWDGFYNGYTRQLMQNIDNQNKEHWLYWKQQHDNVVHFLLLENIVLAIVLGLIIVILVLT